MPTVPGQPVDYLRLIEQDKRDATAAPEPQPAGNPYLSLVQDQKKQRDALTRAAVVPAMDKNPDEYAGHLTLAKETGYPVGVIETDPASIQREQRLNKIADVVGKSPLLQAWAVQDDNAILAMDDFENLSALETAMRAVIDPVVSVQRGLRQSVGRGVAGTGDLIESLAYGASRIAGGQEYADEYMRDAQAAPWWTNPSGLLRGLGGVLTDIGGPASESGIPSIFGIVTGRAGELPESRKNFATDVGEGIGNLLGQIVASRINPAAGVGLMAGQGAQAQAERADQVGADNEQKATAVILGGTITAAVEKLGLDLLLNRMPPNVKNRALGWIVDKAIAGGIEGGEEAIEQVANNLVAQMTYDPNAPIFEGVADSASVGTAVGVIVRSLLGIRGVGLDARQTKAEQTTLDALTQAAAASKLAQRAPERFESLVQQLAQDGARHVYVPAEAVRTLYQSLPPAEVAAQLGVPITEYSEAVITGGDVAIPIGTYLSRVAPQHGEALREVARFTPGSMTPQEAADMDARANEAAERFMASAQTETASDQRVYEDVYGMLFDTRRFQRSDVEKYAQVVQAGFRTLAARTGRDSYDLYASYRLRIKSELPIALQRSDIDTVIDPLIERLRAGDVPSEKAGRGPSLAEFLAEGGGIADEAMSGELRRLDESDRATRAGKPRLVRPDGARSLDYAREAAVEAGYLPDGADINDLLDALDNEFTGKDNRPVTDKATVDLRDTLTSLDDELRRREIDVATATNADIKRALFGEDGREVPDELVRVFEQPMDRIDQTQTEAFKTWSGGAPVVDDMADYEGGPAVFRLFHGTTADFDSFDRERANPESDFGAGFYFSNTPEDVGSNYAGLGPDLTNKLEREAERVAQELEDDPEWSERDDDERDDEAHRRARARFVQHDGATMPVFVRSMNPAIVGGDNETQLTYEEEYDEETDEYGEPTGTLVDFVNALRDVASEYNDGDVEGAIAELYEDGGDIGLADAIAKLKANEEFGYFKDDNGALVSSEIIRRALEQAGFDAIVDYTVDEKFGSQRRIGKKMAGMSADTVHVIAFEPTQVKSSIANQGTFDPSNPSILFQSVTPRDLEVTARTKAGEFRLVDKEVPEMAALQTGGWTREIKAYNAAGEEVGSLLYANDGTPPTVEVAEAFRRQGVATAMLKLARQQGGDLGDAQAGITQGGQKSARSEDGQAFREGADEDGVTLFQAAVIDLSPTAGSKSIKIGNTTIDYGVSRDGQTAEVILVKTPKDKRGSGSARRAMTEFLRAADARGMTVFLTADPMDKGVSKSGLEKFYKSLGFRPNKGRKADFRARAGMVRDPHPIELNQPGADGGVNDAIRRGYIAFGGNRQFTIALLEKADATTFLHETGHFFLEVLGDLATDPNAPAELVADYQAALKWFGVESREQIETKHHEMFARGFEQYLGEGKAPSAELAPLFARFKAWVKAIYRTLRNLNVDLTDDVRGVFDRLLATDVEITQAESSMDYAELFKDARSAGWSDAEFATRLQLQQQARDEAENRLMARAMRDVKRETRAWWKEREAEMRARVTADVHARPVYQALAYLQNGTRPDGTPSEDAAKLDKGWLERQYGQAWLNKHLLRRRVYTVAGGADPDVIAAGFGYSSGDALVQELANAAPMADVIAAETRQRMIDEYGDVLSDGTMPDQAMRAVHGDRRFKAMEADLRALERLAGEPRPSAPQLRRIAETIIAGRKIRDVQPNTYLRAERKAAKEAIQAAGRSEWGAALEAQRRRILNAHLYDVASKAKDETEKLRRYVMRFQKSKLRALLGKINRLDEVDTILDQYDLRRLSGKKIGQDKAKAELLARIDAGEVIAPAGLVRQLRSQAGRTNWQDLTVEDFRGLRDVLKQIEAAAKAEHEAMVNGERVVLDEKAEAMAEATRASGKAVMPVYGELAPDETVKRWGKQALGSWLRPSALARLLDGSDDGAWTRNIIQPIRRAVVEQLEPMKRKAQEDLAGLYRDHYTVKEMAQMNERSVVPGLGVPLSRWDVISLALNWGNLENRQAVLDSEVAGRKLYTERGVGEALETLDARDWRFVQSVWDYVDSYWPQIKETQRRRKGIAPPKVEADPFVMQTRDGQQVELKGGYYPLKYNARLDARARQHDMDEAFERMRAGTLSSVQSKYGHTQERVGSGKQPVLLSMNVLHSHINNVVMDLALGDAVNYVDRVLQRPRVRAALIETGNLDALETWKLWLKDTATGEIGARSGPEQLAQLLRFGFTKSKIGFNAMTVALQVTGLAQTIPVVGASHTAAAVVDMAGRPKQAIAQVMSESAFMRARYELNTFNKDVSAIQEALRSGAPVGKGGGFLGGFISAVRAVQLPPSLVSWAFFGIRQVQIVVDSATWLAGYRKAVGQGLSHAEAVQYADGIVENAQTSGMFSDRSAIERGTFSETTRQSEFVKLWTTLGSYMIAKGNIAFESYKRTNFKSVPSVLAFGADMGLLFAVEALLMGVIKGGLPDDDDDESWWAWTGKTLAEQAAGTIPIVREIPSFIRGYGAGGGPIGSTLSDIGRAVNQTQQGEIDAALVKSYVNLVGTATGLPSTQINRAIDAYWREAEGEDVPAYEYVTGKRK